MGGRRVFIFIFFSQPGVRNSRISIRTEKKLQLYLSVFVTEMYFQILEKRQKKSNFFHVL